MGVAGVEVGGRYVFEHVRKGVFRGRVVGVGENSVEVVLESRVVGMARDWEVGERLAFKPGLVRCVRPVGSGDLPEVL